MSDISSPDQYYGQIVPDQYAAAVAEAPENVSDDTELTATYVITGEGGGTYGLRAHGKTIAFVPGGIEGSDMLTTVTIEDWRKNIAHGAAEPMVDYIRRGKADAAKALKGIVRLDLTYPDGDTYESATVFAGETEPEVTLRMTSDDYAAMLRGDLNGQTAFMVGKLKFEGSLPLLMQVGSLSG